MNKPLSISAYNEYAECARKFDLSRNQRIRPIVSPSYFMTGSVVDEGLNVILEGYDGSLSPETYAKALDVIDEKLERFLVERVEFFDIDYDGECIDQTTREELLDAVRLCGYPGDDIDALAATLMAKQRDLSDKQRKALNLLCHASLRAKTRLMIDAYIAKILPKLTNVSGVQKVMEWTDDKGNKFIGVLDFLATIDGIEVTADNKTSSRPYMDDSVRRSAQFAAYAPQTGRKYAAHFVMEKAIRKNRIRTCVECGHVATGRHSKCDNEVAKVRCNGEWADTIQPEANVQIILDEVLVYEQQITQAALTDVAEAIKLGSFPRNLKSCEQSFGRKKSRCPYYSFCRAGDMTGLEKKEERKK